MSLPRPPSGPTSEVAPQPSAERSWDAAELFHQALPWIISLLAHAVLFMLLALIVWAVQATAQQAALPVAEARIESALTEPMLDSAGSPELALTQDVVPIEADARAEQQFDLLREFSSPSRQDLSIIGIGAGAAGGDLASFGLKSGEIGEGPSFFGLGRDATQARRICYIVDRSGSMVEELDYVKDEVIRSVSRLYRTQQYHIMFFSHGRPLEVPPKKFAYAIDEYRLKSFAFMRGIEPAGSTDPVPAFNRAFNLEADLIYFLTDGEFEPELIEKLRAWNKSKSVRVYTIAFIGRAGESLLKQIARENGGEYRFVSEADLY